MQSSRTTNLFLVKLHFQVSKPIWPSFLIFNPLLILDYFYSQYWTRNSRIKTDWSGPGPKTVRGSLYSTTDKSAWKTPRRISYRRLRSGCYGLDPRTSNPLDRPGPGSNPSFSVCSFKNKFLTYQKLLNLWKLWNMDFDSLYQGADYSMRHYLRNCHHKCI